MLTGQGCTEGWDSCDLQCQHRAAGFHPCAQLHLVLELIPGENHTHRACSAAGHPCSAVLCVQELWWQLGRSIAPGHAAVLSYFLDTHGCSESPHSTREQVSPLCSSRKPKLLPPFSFCVSRCGMSGWPGQQRRGLHAACGTTAPLS